MVLVRGDGVAVVRPRSFSRLDPQARSVMLDLEGVGHHLRIVDRDARELVAEARALGVSWALIGAALSMTGEGARRRYAFGQED